jgi:branched-chain amino acid transport system substrate-binding protein
MMEMEKEYRVVDYESVAKELPELIPLPAKSKYTLGVILPMSGVHHPFGERVLQGIQLAVKEAEIPGKMPLVSLAIRDSKGNPLEAEKVVEELVNKEKVMAILGPLLSIEVERVAKKAQQFKVPLLTLSQKELATYKGDFVFQNSLTPSEQIQTLVDYATQGVGLRTFGVFYPNSPYGLFFKNLFNQEITRKGGKVLGTVIYQEDQTDFTQEIKGFFKIESAQKDDTRKKKEDEFKAGFSVEGLFIPDTHDRVGAILSQMAFYDIKGLTFLGTSAWNGPDLISIAGKEAEGAIFVDAFFKKDPSPLVIRFVQEFQKTYQRDPEILEALGYDATKLLKDILQAKLIPSPLQLKEEIQKIQNFQGVSGLKGFSEDGKAIRTLTILKVDKGQIKKVSP